MGHSLAFPGGYVTHMARGTSRPCGWCYPPFFRVNVPFIRPPWPDRHNGGPRRIGEGLRIVQGGLVNRDVVVALRDVQRATVFCVLGDGHVRARHIPGVVRNVSRDAVAVVESREPDGCSRARRPVKREIVSGDLTGDRAVTRGVGAVAGVVSRVPAHAVTAVVLEAV